MCSSDLTLFPYTTLFRSKLFKELKIEFKEKMEVIEEIKAISDIRQKRIPDIDLKGIREDVTIFERIDEEWKQTIQNIATTVDQTNVEFSQSFITKEERPEVGFPPPLIEKPWVKQISEKEAHRFQEKDAFAEGDNRKLVISREATELHEVIHSIWKSEGKVDLRNIREVTVAAQKVKGGQLTTRTSTLKKGTVKKTTVQKVKADKARAVKKKPAKKGPRKR